MQDIKALLLDLSGVLYEGNTVVAGAREAVARARANNFVLRFVTNTASKSSREILSSLHDFGIEIRSEELFTAPLATRLYAQEKSLRPFVLLNGSVLEEFAKMDQEDPNCVILGDARNDLSYSNLNRAFQLCQAGAPLLAVGLNKYYRNHGELQLDAGGFVKAIEWAADCEALVMGKPSVAFYHQVVKTTGFAAEQCLMVGDDVESDVIGAEAAGLQACLVKTGKYQPGDERADGNFQVIDSIADIEF